MRYEQNAVGETSLRSSNLAGQEAAEQPRSESDAGAVARFPKLDWLEGMGVSESGRNDIGKTLRKRVSFWKWRFPRLEREDLEQEAYFTLVKVVERAQDKGWDEATLRAAVSLYLKQAMERRILRNAATVSISKYDRGRARNWAQRTEALLQSGGRSRVRCEREAALAMGVPLGKVDDAINYWEAVRRLPIFSASLDEPMDFGGRTDEDRPRTRMETVKDRSVLAPNDHLVLREMAA